MPSSLLKAAEPLVAPPTAGPAAAISDWKAPPLLEVFELSIAGTKSLAYPTVDGRCGVVILTAQPSSQSGSSVCQRNHCWSIKDHGARTDGVLGCGDKSTENGCPTCRPSLQGFRHSSLSILPSVFVSMNLIITRPARPTPVHRTYRTTPGMESTTLQVEAR